MTTVRRGLALTAVKSYFEDLARMEDLKLIDEHEFIERVYADMPPLWRKAKAQGGRRMITLLIILCALGALTVAGAVLLIAYEDQRTQFYDRSEHDRK